MKTQLIRGGVILATIILAVFLFIFGKEHAIYIENKGETFTPKTAYYILDGKKEVKVRKKKKKREYAKGPSHVIEVRFKNKDGKEIKITREFKVELGKKITINLALIESEDKWIKKEEIKKETKK